MTRIYGLDALRGLVIGTIAVSTFLVLLGRYPLPGGFPLWLKL